MKLCKDCKHFVQLDEQREVPDLSFGDWWRNKKPSFYTVTHYYCNHGVTDPVTGTVLKGHGCLSMREEKDKCGPSGDWWEAKE